VLNPAVIGADPLPMSEVGDTPDAGAGMISGATISVLARCVERVAGQGALERVLARSGEPMPADEVRAGLTWTSYANAVAMFRAGIEVTGDPGFPRAVGEEMLRQYEGSEVAALFRSLGSPGEVLRNVAMTSTKFSTATVLEAVEIGDDHAVVDAWAIRGLERDVTFCDYTAGVISQASVLFGMDAAQVEEVRCQRLGAPRCRYEVRWDVATSPDVDPHRRIRHLEAQLQVITERFEHMQKTTRELVSAEGVEHVLAAITRRAAHAVRATRHLLAVSLAPGDLRLHTHGFRNDEEAHLVADEILADEPDERDGSRLIVDIVSGDRMFGRLAALYPEGARFFPAERRLLEAYAATAAAALNVATALEEARRQNETARALLALASSLAEARTVETVAERLAAAVPVVVGTARGSVLVWDPQEGVLAHRGVAGVDPTTEAAMRASRIHRRTTPELHRMVECPAPMVLDVRDASPSLRDSLHTAHVERVCIVPLVARGEFYGVVTAPISPDGDLPPYLWERLQGLADQGATALQNAQLVEQIRHKALHDALTGMPNRMLFEDRLTHALAAATRERKRVGVLFIDLDQFKRVNDTYGHACGDELLRQVATRLSTTVRATDTVARLGGDEFVILLSEVDDVDDAHAVATKLLDVLRRPYDVGGGVLSVSASIGVTVAKPGETPDALLSHADDAMYRAKAAGRDRVELAA
jgi:diguanylate cyclase (GGDEF)-like protein